MKHLKLLALLLLVPVYIACSSDDDNNTTQEEVEASLVGTWTAETIDFDSTITTTVEGLPVTATQEGEGFDIDATITFSEDPNTVNSDGQFSMTVTTTFLGVSETETLENLDLIGDGMWTLSDNTLVITGTADDQDATITVELLTADSLRLRIEQTEMLDTPVGTGEVDAVFVATFSR
ncbi:hypothetical protein BTO09_03440 [Gilvibacter sp. SZ-19]|uniref:hypothetical protein n=1 Tax=Gilvibacter sp. SZ-19 TaxID=754429 RepID=UPI000B3C294F|nr:hypothetical protein [Gilvibacter sp. SZ-19]ARV11449.1 hypothetical protein BTO09_03440 [Gilvibacter sp. SZ-19]